MLLMGGLGSFDDYGNLGWGGGRGTLFWEVSLGLFLEGTEGGFDCVDVEIVAIM